MNFSFEKKESYVKNVVKKCIKFSLSEFMCERNKTKMSHSIVKYHLPINIIIKKCLVIVF